MSNGIPVAVFREFHGNNPKFHPTACHTVNKGSTGRRIDRSKCILFKKGLLA